MLARRAVLLATAILTAVGIWWGLPGSESWAADAISPRGAGLGAIVETYAPGHHHIYPPLHMLLLTVLSLPVLGWGVATAGTSPAALEAALIQTGPMTVIEVIARIVAVAMTVGVVHFTMRTHEDADHPAVAPLAGLAAATVAPLAYYGKTGNLDVPALFWATACLAELGRLARDRDATDPRRAALYAVAAVLTKDQIAGVLLVPALVVAARWARDRRLLTRPVAVAVAAAAAIYLLVSGALVNPTGWAARVRELFGPASRTWEGYPRTTAGTYALLSDALLAVPRLSSWPMLALAAVGLVIAVRRRDRVDALLPALGALSFTLTFTLGARRTEDRFLLAQAVLLFPYAGAAMGAVLGRARPAGVAVSAVAIGASVLGVASVDATLLADARYPAERWLAALPPGTTVEVYGGPKFLPRLPATLSVARVGTDPVAARSHLPSVAEIVDPAMDPGARRPEVVVLSSEFSHAVGPLAPAAPHGVSAYMDEASRRFFDDLTSERLAYARALRAECTLPWPLACRRIHGSTGEPVWIYARRSQGPL
jgi:hypothetical protein